jgi:P27 family predicted phage terminase small subunit
MSGVPGRSGRKKKPTHLKLVTGTARKSRLNPMEPMPDLARPLPPEELMDEAKVEWGRVVDELYLLGILTRVDRAVLAAYCQAYGRWVRAERTLAQMAAADNQSRGVLITANGNVIQNPIIGIANKAMADCVRYAAELGMTPSARSRVEARPPGPFEADKYLV